MNAQLIPENMDSAQRKWQSTKDEALRVAADVILPVKLMGWHGTDDTPTLIQFDGKMRFGPAGIEGVESVVLVSPPGHTTMLVRGTQGAHREKVRYPNRITVHCLKGALVFFIEGQEPRLVEEYKAGNNYDCDVLEIAPMQRFGWVATSEFLNYNFFSPELPRILNGAN